MKKIFILINLLLFTVMLMAQQDSVVIKSGKNGRFILDFNAGYSMPFGKYTSTNKDENFGGFASHGFFVQASGNWLGRFGFGIAASYCFQRNFIQHNADTITPVGHYEPLGKKPWTNHYLIAGPVLIKSFGKFTLTVKALAGGGLSYSSTFKIWLPSDPIDSLTPGPMNLSQGPGLGVAFQALAGIGYNITDNLTLNLSFSYMGANPLRTKDYYVFNYVYDPEAGYYRPVYQGGERQVRKRISTFNIGLGIGIKL